MLRSGHSGLGQKSRLAAADSGPCRIQRLAVGSIPQKGPYPKGLAPRQPQGGGHFLLVQPQKLPAGRRGPKGPGGGSGVPALLPVGGDPQSLAHPGHGLVPADHRQEKLLPAAAQLFRQPPGGGDHHHPNVGLGPGVQVVQSQSVPRQGIEEHRRGQRGLRPPAPQAHPALLPGKGQIDPGVRPGKRGLCRPQSRSQVVQQQQADGFPDLLRDVLPAQPGKEPGKFP